MIFYLLFILCLAGAWFARMDGGSSPQIHEQLQRALLISPFVAVSCLYAGWYGIFAALGVVGVATGIGQYFLDRIFRGQKDTSEGIDPFVSLIMGKDWRTQFNRDYVFNEDEREHYFSEIRPKLYKRNVFALFVRGSLVGIPSAIICAAFGAYAPAAILSLTGLVHAITYMVGEYLRTNGYSTGIDQLQHGVPFSEFLNGFFRTALAAVAIWMGLA